MNGEPPGPPGICPPKTAPSVLLAISLHPFLSSAGVRMRLSEFCVQQCMKCFANRRLESSWFSHTARVSWRSAVAFGKQMLGEPSCSVTIGRIRSEYETVPPWFQRFNIISDGMFIVTNYNRMAWCNLSCVLQAYYHLSTNVKLPVSWRF